MSLVAELLLHGQVSIRRWPCARRRSMRRHRGILATGACMGLHHEEAGNLVKRSADVDNLATRSGRRGKGLYRRKRGGQELQVLRRPRRDGVPRQNDVASKWYHGEKPLSGWSVKRSPTGIHACALVCFATYMLKKLTQPRVLSRPKVPEQCTIFSSACFDASTQWE